MFSFKALKKQSPDERLQLIGFKASFYGFFCDGFDFVCRCASLFASARRAHRY